MTRRALWLLPPASGLALGALYYEVLPAPLVFAALVPLFFFLDRTRSWKARAVAGFFAGFPYYLLALHPLAFVSWFGFVESEGTFMVVAHAVLAAMAGLCYAAFAAVYPRAGHGWRSLAFVPAAFVLMDCAKQLFSFGFGWGFLGYLFESMGPFLRGVALAGVPGATFLIVLVNLIATRALAAASARDFRRARTLAALAALACALYVGAGWLVQRFAIWPVAPIRVAVMETENQRGSSRLDVHPYPRLFAAATRYDAEVILMPESLIDPKRQEMSLDEMAGIISRLAQDYAGTVIVGGFRRENGQMYNSSFFWRGDVIESFYDKRYLVPFAEYAPRLLSRFGPEGAVLYEHGEGGTVSSAGGVLFGTLVCQEVNYPLAGLLPTRAGAEILVSGANDGFAKESPLLRAVAPSDDPWFERIEYRMARFRAVENGRYLLRSTKVGIAGIIGPAGNDVAVISSGERGVAVQDIQRMGGLTPYAMLGDWPFLAACAALVAASLRRRRAASGDKKEKVFASATL